MQITEISFIDPRDGTVTTYSTDELMREARHIRKHAKLTAKESHYTLTIRGAATLAVFDRDNVRGAGTAL